MLHQHEIRMAQITVLQIHQPAGLTAICSVMLKAQQCLSKFQSQRALAQAGSTAEKQRMRTLLGLQIVLQKFFLFCVADNMLPHFISLR